MEFHFHETQLTSVSFKLTRAYCTKYPDKYKEWQGDPFWHSTIDVVQFVDVLIHLLLLGITKGTTELIYEWISDIKSLVGYKNFANNIF